MKKETTETTTVETEKELKGKPVFSFSLPTPKWAIYVFRTEFFINKALMLWLTGTTIVPTENAKEYILILVAIDTVVWGLSRSIGIRKEDFEN